MEGTSTSPRPRTVAHSLPQAKRKEAYVAALQRDLNQHLKALGSPALLSVDGEFGTDTELALQRVCKVLGVEPAQSVRVFRVIAGAASPRSEQELERAATEGAAYAARLRKRFTDQPQPAPQDPVAARLHAAGVRYADVIAREAARSGLPASLICAVLEVETGFRNVFGHDAVRNPVKSPPGGLLEVTEARYQDYLRHRKAGEGNQGVGPMQLTSPGLQDRADALGGCWKPDANLRVGVEFLAGNIRRLGLRAGVIAYNGAAPYADKVFPAQARWQARLGATGGSGPRTLKVPMQGPDVLALQKLVNRRFQEWQVAARVAEDGAFGPETRIAAKRVAYGLGLEIGHGITPALRMKMRRPSRRTRDELARATARRDWLRALRTAVPYPLAAHGPVIGLPYHGTHTRGNWQSDNAVDIRVPEGTGVLALADGVIVKTFKSPSGVTAGWQVTLLSADNGWFYGHLKTIDVRAGQRVRRGQTIGTSGSANGVPHLHIGQRDGRPPWT